MVGLILTEAMLFLAAGLLGFAIGWSLFRRFSAERRRVELATLDQLRQALTEAQVRRARAP